MYKNPSDYPTGFDLYSDTALLMLSQAMTLTLLSLISKNINVGDKELRETADNLARELKGRINYRTWED